jgi:hypothetical protein
LSYSAVHFSGGDYFVATEEAESLQSNYLEKNPDRVFVVPSMPSFPMMQGCCTVKCAGRTNGRGQIINGDWHFALIANSEGVALERIDPNGVSQDPSNWLRRIDSRYGTPTYVNSQLRQLPAAKATIEITPKIISPDNDGRG